MNRERGSCVAITHGGPCSEPATMAEPVALCDEHKIEVALLVTRGVLTAALTDVHLNQSSVGSPVEVPDVDAHIIDSAQALPMPTADRHGSLVYFLANGGRVKIGYTKNLVNRLHGLSLRDDAVLLLLQGGRSLERALHAKFAIHRIGDSEWFELAPDLIRFIAEKGPHANTATSARKGPRRRVYLEPTRQRRTDKELVADLQLLVAAHYRAHPLKQVSVKPLAKQLGIGRDRCRRLLAEMNVRPMRKAANQ